MILSSEQNVASSRSILLPKTPSTWRKILSAHATALGNHRLSTRADAVLSEVLFLKLLHDRIPATIAMTRFRPSSHPRKCIQFRPMFAKLLYS